MKMIRIAIMVLVFLALLAPAFAQGQEAEKPNPTVVAVASVVADKATSGAVEVAKEATAEAKQTVSDAVKSMTPSEIAKQKILESLLGFLDVTKNTIEDGIGATKDGMIVAGKFAGTQIPLVLKELVLLRRIEVIAYASMTLIIALIVYFSGKKIWAWIVKSEETDEDFKGSEAHSMLIMISIVMRVLSVLMPVLIFTTNLRDWILPWASSRVYLIEYSVKFMEKLQGN